MLTNVNAEISPLISPQSKPTPVRASAAPLVRQWATQNGGSLNGANTLAKDLEGFAHSINGILTTLKQAPTLNSVNTISNAIITISNGTDSITLDPVSDTMIITNGVNVTTIDPRGPSITMVTGTGGNKLTLTISGSTLTIAGTGTEAGQGNITIDGIMTAASAVFSGALQAASAVFSGALQAASAVISGVVNAGSVATGNVSATSFTASGLPGISVVRTFRNAAGTGTSTDTVTDGIITSYTP